MSEKFGKNKHLVPILDDYLKITKPQFALLINSKWGCGKTWFARQYIEYYKDIIKSPCENTEEKQYVTPVFCYVSLFDIADSKEIDAAILQQTNSVLFSKKAQTGGRIGRFILEKSVSFLPIPITSEDVTKCVGLLKELFNGLPEHLVIVLDDLERTRLPMELVLGYASNLLEESDAHVILLCNEKEILGNISGDTSTTAQNVFYNFKEKVVGITLSVEPDVESVFCSCCSNLTNAELSDVFANNKCATIEIFELSESQNMRHLRRIFYEFTRIYDFMNSEAKKNKEFLCHILNMLAIFSIEINDKNMSFDDIDYFEQFSVSSMSLHSSNDEKSAKIRNKIKKYSSVVSNFFGLEFFKSFFSYGIITKEGISILYSSSPYAIISNDTPVPIKLWHLYDMNDSDVESLYETMGAELSSLEYAKLGVILHAFGNMIALQELGICTHSSEEIVSKAKDYLSRVGGKLDTFGVNFAKPYPGYSHLGFHECQSETFKSIFAHFKAHTEQYERQCKTENIQRCLELLPADVDGFVNQFPFDPEQYRNSTDIPLHKIDVKVFAAKFALLQTEDVVRVKNRIIEVFSSHTSPFFRLPKSAGCWLTAFADELQIVSNGMPPIAGRRVQNFIPTLRAFSSNLKSS